MPTALNFLSAVFSPVNQGRESEIMAPGPESNPIEEDDGYDDVVPSHHPSAPLDELFNISTTVDPGYIISLMRRLLPEDAKNGRDSDGDDAFNQGRKADHMKESVVSPCGDEMLNSSHDKLETMDTLDGFDGLAHQEKPRQNAGEVPCGRFEDSSILVGEKAWEEYGCVLWDLAASRTHSEFMVENLMLEVLLASLTVTQSMRVKEIGLGILGNLACHEIPMRKIVLTDKLIEIVVDQLFLDDTPCLCAACRLLTLGLQSSECVTWAKALQSEQNLSRVIWVAENTLNLQLLEKSIGLLLAILESQEEIVSILLPTLMNLGLPSLLINLLTFEMSKLASERIPERYSILDLILRTIEALSVLDDYSQDICSNKEVFCLLSTLIRLLDKAEVANSCLTAAVLIANILIDSADLASEISQDLTFLAGLLDIFPFASDDPEASGALWSIMARILVQVKECKISSSSLRQYVSVLVSKSDLIEEDLLNHQWNDSSEDNMRSITSSAKLHARTTALRRIINILNQWTTSRDCSMKNNLMEPDDVNDENVERLLNCCQKYIDYSEMKPKV